jgi:hypothetical protein
MINNNNRHSLATLASRRNICPVCNEPVQPPMLKCAQYNNKYVHAKCYLDVTSKAAQV